MVPPTPFDAIVLAGGAASRLGGADKPAVELGGASMLERVLAAAGAARRRVVAGPVRPVDAQVVWCREDPPGGGPLAALAAALPHTGAPLVLVLAADLPWIAPAVPRLLTAIGDQDAAVLVDASGRRNLLAAAWRRPALVDALAALQPPAGRPVRALAGYARIVGVADPAGWGEDCDTWDDIARARARLTGSTP